MFILERISILVDVGVVAELKQDQSEWRVEVLSSLAQMRAYEHLWRELETQCSDPHASFQGWAWCLNWAEIYCHDEKCSPAIFLIYQHGELIALLPLMVENRSGLNILAILGEPHTQIAAALVKDGANCILGLRLCFENHVLDAKADAVSIGPVVEGSPLAFALNETMLDTDPAEYMSLVTWRSSDRLDDYLSGISKNRRKDFRQKLRRLEKFGDVEFRRCRPDNKDFAVLVDEGLQLKREWLINNGMVSVGLSRASTGKFLRSLSSSENGFEPELDVLTVAGKLVAVTLNIIARQSSGKAIRQCYLSAYDETYANASPGTLIHQMAIHATLEDGEGGYNFLGHPTHFKAMWANKHVSLLRYQQAITLRGTLWLELWAKRLRPGTKKAATLLRSTSQGRALAKVLLKGKND